MAALANDLPVGYYRDNFQFLLDFVLARYADLLSPAEQAYASGFGQLSLPAQRLYVRLALRKGPVFRSDKIAYAEIPACAAAAAELMAAGYVDAGADAAYEVLLGLLVMPELRRLGPGLAGSGRAALVASLLASTTVADFHASISFKVYRPCHLVLLRTFRLLFFGNLQQDFTEFVLNDLGIMPYERYAIDANTRFFESRLIIDQALQLADLGERVMGWLETNDREQLLGYTTHMPDPVEPGLQRRLDRLSNRVARQLERLAEPTAALAIYRRSCSGEARERQARLLATVPDLVAGVSGVAPKAALAACWQIIEGPESEAELEFAVAFAARLYKKMAQPVPAALPLLTPVVYPQQQLVLLQVPGTRVELAVAEYFEAAGSQAHYVENSLFTALFGLAFWDIIFAPVRGAFFNPFQRRPADLFTPDFALKRAAALRARLAEVACKAALQTRVLDAYGCKQGLANPFVNWSGISLQLLELGLAQIPTNHLQVIFKRLLADPRANRSGFPDLIIFPPAGGYELVEVKAPNDKLQANQLRWLRCFAGARIPHQVVNVLWR